MVNIERVDKTNIDYKANNLIFNVKGDPLQLVKIIPKNKTILTQKVMPTKASLPENNSLFIIY